jgi:hypothetical protein
MTGPGDQRTARPAGHGRLRASHADREQVISVLKAAFVQDRLTKDEFDARVGQALASRTYADLTVLTADLPAGLATAQPPREPARAQVQPPGAKGVRSSVRVMHAGTTLTASVWAVALLTGSATVLMLAFTLTIGYIGTLLLAGAVLLESRREQRSGGQPPPRSGPGGGARAAPPPASAPPGSQVPRIDRGPPHVAEAARRLLPRPQLPGLGFPS